MSISHHDTAGFTLGALFAHLSGLATTAFMRAEQSHQRRLGYAEVSAEVQRDISLSSEEATGLSSHQPDLPFYMQTGFGRR